MKKTITVNIGGRVFYIDDNAYEILRTYLSNVKKEFKAMNGGNEIYEDIEARIAELFNEKLGNKHHAITLKEVEEVIDILGQPEDFSGPEDSDKSRTTSGRSTRRMYRDPDNRFIGGVCSGLAAYWQIDPTIVRLIFVILVLLGFFGGVIYIVLWILLPEAHTVAQKLEMRGEPVNLSSIGAFLREEFENVKNSFRKK